MLTCYAQILEKLKGHIALGLSVHPCKIKERVLKFKRQIPDPKISDLYFLSLDYLPLLSYAPLKGPY